VALVNPEYNRKNRDVLYVSITIIAAVFLFTMTVSILNESTLGHHTASLTDAYAQPSVETVKHRNLTIDLGNGLKTNAELTVPAVGEGPFPGVLLIHGSGANDMNETGGLILVDNETGSKIYPDKQTLFQIAEYLSERGFVVLRYDKRGVSSNFTLSDDNVWGNVTFDDLKQDAEKALSVLLQQPEVNASKKATLIGHSEGTMIAPRIAVANPDEVRDIVLMGAVANTLKDLLYFQIVTNPLDYVEKVLDKSHRGMLTLEEVSNDSILQNLVGGNLTHLLLVKTNLTGSENKSLAETQQRIHTVVNQDTISIENELKPALLDAYHNVTSPSASALAAKCLDVQYRYFEWTSGLEGCPKWMKSHSNLESSLSMIGNVSSSIGILVLQGENDTATPVEQGLLLQQRLTEVNHPDHLLITYPNLGHSLSPSNEWIAQSGPVEDYVLQNMFEWLTSPAREVNEELR
jgi:pimeloyl-ACP methyl ester carboxylesterase